MAMLAVMYAIGANTLLALIIPVFTDHKVATEGTGEMKLSDANPFTNPVMQIVFVVIRYFGFGAVIVGVYLFEPPKELWEGPVPEVSPAVGYTVTLSIAFFSVYLLMAISRSYTQFVAGSTETTQFEEVMAMAANSMAMAPMLCVLFRWTRCTATRSAGRRTASTRARTPSLSRRVWPSSCRCAWEARCRRAARRETSRLRALPDGWRRA